MDLLAYFVKAKFKSIFVSTNVRSVCVFCC